MIRRAVVDFSAFVGLDKQVLFKELTIIDVDSLATQHWVFKPPKNIKRECPPVDACGLGADWPPFPEHNKWLSKHFHGLSFDSGSTDYESLQGALREYCSRVQLLYAPSTEKAKELEKILCNMRVVFSLEALGCPPLPRGTLTPSFAEDEWNEGPDNGVQLKQCLLHRMVNSGFYCTQSNAQQLVRWCRANPSCVDMNLAENRLKTFAGHWPNITVPSPTVLADNGFVRVISDHDATKCVYCGLVLHQWIEGDDVAWDHELHSPYCCFLRYKHQRNPHSVKVEATGCDEPDLISAVIEDSKLFESCHA